MGKRQTIGDIYSFGEEESISPLPLDSGLALETCITDDCETFQLPHGPLECSLLEGSLEGKQLLCKKCDYSVTTMV